MWERILRWFGKKSDPFFKDRCILYIDDNQNDRAVVQKILARRDYRVVLCATAEEGWEAIQKKRPDLILLDIVLPGISGIDLCRRLKTDSSTKNIPIIFLTGVDTPKNVIDCYEYGAEDFLNKKVSPSLLVSQIEFTLKEYTASNT